MFNKGDLVYIYLFDLKKTLPNMNKLRDDRFGIITDINVQRVQGNVINEQTLIYKIRNKNNDVMEYNTSSLTYSMISINELIELIGSLNMSQDKKHVLLEQIGDVGASLK